MIGFIPRGKEIHSALPRHGWPPQELPDLKLTTGHRIRVWAPATRLRSIQNRGTKLVTESDASSQQQDAENWRPRCGAACLRSY